MPDSFEMHTGPETGRLACACTLKPSYPELIAITGGPGAGKTAVLRLAANVFCRHVAFIPESATLLFSGGFWRRSSDAGLRAAQTAIFHTQKQLETVFIEDNLGQVGLCDRGTVDGFAYWPKGKLDYWEAMGTSREREMQRYKAVIHLRTPTFKSGYDRSNPARTEDIIQARKIDDSIFLAWDGHTQRHVIEADVDFRVKVELTLQLLKDIMKLG